MASEIGVAAVAVWFGLTAIALVRQYAAGSLDPPEPPERDE